MVDVLDEEVVLLEVTELEGVLTDEGLVTLVGVMVVLLVLLEFE